MYLVYFIVFSLLALAPSPTHASRGNSLSFQGVSIAGHRKGFIDFTDPGWEDVDDAFSVAFWFRFRSYGYVCTFGSDLHHYMFSPIWYSESLAFNNFHIHDHSFYDWTHIAITVDSVNGTRIYVNGNLDGEYDPSADASLRRLPETAFTIGAHLYNFHKRQLTTNRVNGFQGDIDEFGLWSRALSQDYIVENLVNGSLAVDQVQQDNDTVLYYNFDVTCTNPDDARNNAFRGDSCDGVGNGIITNHGSAGSNYDLLLGQVNDDYGFGKTYVFADSDLAPQTFEMPHPSYSSPLPLSMDRISSPSVYTVYDEPIEVELLTDETYVVDQLPVVGRLSLSTNESHVIDAAGAEIPPGTAKLYYLPDLANSESTFDWLYLNVSAHGLHQVQLLLNVAPPTIEPLVTNNQYTMLESAGTTVKYVDICSSNCKGFPSERFTAHCIPPKNGLLFYLASSAVHVVTPELEIDFVEDLVYFPVTGFSGKDQFSCVLTGIDSGLESNSLTYKIEVIEDDDLPIVADRVIQVDQDSQTGTSFTLHATDDEPGTLGIAITKLPTKGDLFHVNPLTNETTRIEDKYEIFRIENIVHQYASRVLAVSSFKPNPPLLVEHPMGILGRPKCYNTYGDCKDRRFAVEEYELNEPQVGDIIYLNRHYQDPETEIVHVAVKVTRVDLENGMFDANVLPLYKRVQPTDANMTGCFMVTSVYPDGCDTAEFATRQGSFAFENVPIEKVRSVDFLAYTPASFNYVAGSEIDGGDASAAYGEEFRFFHRPDELYENNSPPYSEFIEIGFDTAVFPVQLQVGEPRGGGSIVRILARSPTGEWDELYSGEPLLSDHKRTTAVGLYHVFDEVICRAFYRVDTLRIEFDTSKETGVPDINIMEFVKLTGSLSNQPAALGISGAEVLYVPHPLAEGADSFEYASFDCGGSSKRSSEPATVKVNITSKPDFPLATVLPAHDLNLIDPSSSSEMIIEVQDPDIGDTVQAKVVDSNFAIVHLKQRTSAGSLVPVAVNEVLHILAATDEAPAHVALVLTAPACISENSQDLSFTVSVEDTTGRVTTLQAGGLVVCARMPVEHQYDTTKLAYRPITTALGVIGLLCSAIACAFNVMYRKRSIIRVTSPRINILICFGTALVYTYLIVSSRTLQDVSTCSGLQTTNPDVDCGNVEDDDEVTLSCCRSSTTMLCSQPMLLISFGVGLTFAPLLAKTERIIQLFHRQKMQFRIISDREVFKHILMLMSPLMVICAVWMLAFPFVGKFQDSSTVIDVDRQIATRFLILKCDSQHLSEMTLAILVYFVLLILFGANQAYQVRNVIIKQSNDSKSLAVSIYNVVVLGGLALVLEFAIVENGANHMIVTFLVWLTTTIILVALFVPRFMEVANNTELLTRTKAPHLHHSSKQVVPSPSLRTANSRASEDNRRTSKQDTVRNGTVAWISETS